VRKGIKKKNWFGDFMWSYWDWRTQGTSEWNWPMTDIFIPSGKMSG
jgi:hypothetical protein